MVKKAFLLFGLLMAILLQTVYAIPVKMADLPAVVRDTIQREVDTYRVRGINQATIQEKTVYQVEARGRSDRKLTLRIAEDGSVLSKVYEGQFSIADNRLLRQGNPFRIESLYTPQAGDPAQAPKNLIEAIGDFSYAGGNVLAFDLYGLNADGTALSSEADAFYQKLIDRMIYTQVSCICRVFGDHSPKDPEIRRNAVHTVADYFKKENQFIFWIDGPDAETLGKEFKAIAPGLVVAAPGADMEITESFPTTPPAKPTLVVGEIPEDPKNHFNFLAPDTPQVRAALDEWNSIPEDHQPWTPDNSALSEEERKEGFVALFDGKTTNGWIPLSPSGGGYIVKDGTLQRKPNGGSIRTVKRFGDFVLRLDFMIEKNGNSGVQVRCPRGNRQSKIGFEVQILGDYQSPVSPDSTGAIYHVIAPTENASNPAMEWNTMEITCQGSHVQVILNGKKVQDLNFDDYDELKYRLRDGFIILTDHGNFAAYRNMRIKELK